jgi:hypothetical protein
MYNVLTRNVVTRRSKSIEGDIGTMRTKETYPPLAFTLFVSYYL